MDEIEGVFQTKASVLSTTATTGKCCVYRLTDTLSEMYSDLLRNKTAHVVLRFPVRGAEFTRCCYYDSSGEINQESLIAPFEEHKSHALMRCAAAIATIVMFTSAVSSSPYRITGVVCNGLITILCGEGEIAREKLNYHN